MKVVKLQLQDDGPDHDVAVHQRHADQPRAVEDARAVAPDAAREGVAAEPEAKGKAGPFGDQRGDGDAGHAPAEAEDEPDAEDDVQAVLPDLHGEDPARALGGDQPALDGIGHDRRGRAPDADREIGQGEGFDGVRGRCDGESPGEQRALEGDEDQPRRQPDQQGADQDRAAFRVIARAMRLRGQPAGAHAQEPEDPVERGQDHRTDADRADGRGQAHLPDDRDIDRAQQRHCRVRQNDGPGDAQDAGMGDRVGGPARFGRRSRHAGGGSGSGIRKCPVACAKGRARLSCQASTCTDAKRRPDRLTRPRA